MIITSALGHFKFEIRLRLEINQDQELDHKIRVSDIDPAKLH